MDSARAAEARGELGARPGAGAFDPEDLTGHVVREQIVAVIFSRPQPFGTKGPPVIDAPTLRP
jgi:hypothetical protein